jgi:anti-sigma factor RsiW
MTCERLADFLDACLDGETDAVTLRDLEAHLAHCPSCSSQLAARRALQTALREKLPYYAAPAALKRPHQPRRRLAPYAIAASLLLLGAAAGFLLRPPAAAPDLAVPFVAAVESAHLRSLQEQHLVDVASSDRHTVKPWFAGRISFSPSVPDFPDFPLRGGRLDIMQNQPAAVLVYASAKHTINLFIWPAAQSPLPATPEPRSTSSGFHLLLWSDGSLNYCAISDVEPAHLQEFARLYRQSNQEQH